MAFQWGALASGLQNGYMGGQQLLDQHAQSQQQQQMNMLRMQQMQQQMQAYQQAYQQMLASGQAGGNALMGLTGQPTQPGQAGAGAGGGVPSLPTMQGGLPGSYPLPQVQPQGLLPRMFPQTFGFSPSQGGGLGGQGAGQSGGGMDPMSFFTQLFQ